MKVALAAIVVALCLTVLVTAVFFMSDIMIRESISPSNPSTGPQFDIINLTLMSNPDVGDRVPIRVTVRNTGDQAGDFVMEVNVSWLDQIVTNTVLGIEPKTSKDSLFNLWGPRNPGIYTAQAGNLTLTFEVVK